MKVIIVGGGWSGCAASLSAHKQGAEVILVERTDMLLGTGLVGGIMRNNGRFTAAEEMIAMAGGELLQVTDQNSLHRNIDFPGHHHASLYNVATMEPLVKKFLLQEGIEIHLTTRIEDLEKGGTRIKAVTGKCGDEKIHIEGDIFIDATGTAGPPTNCNKYGNGCAMCILRCPSFGGPSQPHCQSRSPGDNWKERESYWSALRSRENVFFDTALAGTETIMRFVEKIGKERILFGSDIPFGTMTRELEKILSLPLGDDEKEWVLSRNLKRLIGWDEKRTHAAAKES